MSTARGLDIVWYPHPALRRKNKPVLEIDDELVAISKAMIELMHRDKGVGLACPQVGLAKRMFIMNPTAEPGGETVVINPVISKRRGGKDVMVEGCLSLPGVNGKVKRHVALTMSYYDLEGQEITEELEGFPARVALHEYDHLEGVLIIDRMSPAERSVADRRLKELVRRHES